jgi:hypothetical protein
MGLLEHVREGSLVEVKAGPLRVASDDHNFGIVVAIKNISGQDYADVVTNTGHHRLITPDRLDVHSEEADGF